MWNSSASYDYNQGARLIVPGRRALVLKGVSAHTTIVSSTSRTVLKQTFSNPTDESFKEATYVFPLFDGISIVSYSATIGSRVIKGTVKEKEAARKAFDAAAAKGEKAGLLEHSIDAKDVFTTTMANIGPGEDVVVEIVFLGELKHDAEADGLRLTFPTHIAPRYGETSVILVSNVQPQNPTLDFTVDVDAGAGATIKSVQSPSHPVSVSVGTTSAAPNADPSLQRAHATFSVKNNALDKDLIIQVCASNIGDPWAVVEEHPSIPNRRALMATLVPRFNLPVETPEIVFVCDRSGSMGDGRRIPNMISALQVFLKSLPVGALFNICSFGSHHSSLWEKSQPYNQQTLEEATKHIKTFAADFGGTEMLEPVKAKIDERNKERNLELFLLTDGDIWRQEELCELISKSVKDSNNAIRVFTLGIGSSVSHALIEGVARAGQGFSQTVADDEKMSKKVVRMLKAALTAHINDYSLDIRYEKADDDEFELIEKVNDVLVLDDAATSEATTKVEETTPAPKPTISLHDKSVSNEDLEMKDHDSTPLPVTKAPAYLQAPYHIPALYPFVRTSVYVLLPEENTQRQPKSVVLKGTSPYGPLELEIPVSRLAEKGTTIHQLAARKATLELEEGKGWVYEAKDADGKTLVDTYPMKFQDIAKAAAVKLGVEYQVSNKWCSFVALEDDTATTLSEDAIAEEAKKQEREYSMAQPVAKRSRMAMSLAMPMSAASSRPVKQMAASYAAVPDAALGMPMSASFCAAPLPPPPPAMPSYGMSHAPPPGGLMSKSISATYIPTGQDMYGEGVSIQDEPMAACDEEEDDDGAVLASSTFGKNLSSYQPSGNIPTNPYAVESLVDTADISSGSPAEDLAAAQSFDGFWTFDKLLAKLTGVSLEDAKSKIGLTTVAAGEEDKVYATLLAVAYLEAKCKEDEEVWELFVAKAKTWLKGMLAGDALAEAEKKALQLV
ncbi:hypothetical protein VHEMI05431 [[Torrubiella] hemipterigena]|uniref:von Willebrand domain containing protein n=1 Tax=[Torrubiella] hemipterigena TaxID=1531966 RepID=A0A0A1TGM3_9HYPO|nr:hypothetical protein VHEMI05431 [[Torrubiella] hemipterigena]